MGKKLIVLFLAVVMAFSVVEIFLRLRGTIPIRVVNESIYPGTFGDYKPSQEMVSDYVLPHYIKINSLGLRGDEIDLKKQEGTYRILVLGDSFTFGSRVDNDESFPEQLGQLFNGSSRGAGRKVEVINAGHGAYSTREEYEYLLEKGIYFAPDLVILAWFPNDIKELWREYSWRDLLKSHYKYEPFKSYIRSFAVFNTLRIYVSHVFIRHKFGPYVPKEEIDIYDDEITPKEYAAWEKCSAYILKIVKLCDDNGAKFMLVGLPDFLQFEENSGNELQNRLAELSRDNDLIFLDLTERFKKEDDVGKLYLYPKDCHFNSAGNKAVAEEIFGFLNKQIKGDI